MEKLLVLALGVLVTVLCFACPARDNGAGPVPQGLDNCSQFAVKPNADNAALRDCVLDNYESWPLFPNTTPLKRLGIAVHGRWVTTRVNPIAFEYLDKVVHERNPRLPVELPNGSILVKENFGSSPNATRITPDQRVLGVLTYFYKPDPNLFTPPQEFCATPQLPPYNGTDACLGGGWLYSFYKFPSPLVNATALNDFVRDNANTFCINCHAPAFETDYLRTLHTQLVPFNTSPQGPIRGGEGTFQCNVGLNSTLPGDVPLDPLSLTGNEAQEMFDCFSWQTFVALNWPASRTERGKPNTSRSFRGPRDGPAVWETYKPTYEVFQPNIPSWDPSNQPFNQTQPQINGTNCDTSAGELVVTMSSKTRDVVNETGQAFAGTFGDLRDRNQKLVRYEVLFNEIEFDYVKTRAATRKLTPAGPAGETVEFPEGAVEVKSAWKELCLEGEPGCRYPDDPGKFYHREGLIYDVESNSCRRSRLGLVGLHVVVKTHWAPQWIWATFEQQDNVPPFQEETQATFFDPECPGSTADCFKEPFFASSRCCVNVQAPRFNASRFNQSNQLTRLVPIREPATTLNAQFQDLVGPPFDNYVLVNTQWPLNGRTSDGRVNTKNCTNNLNGTNCFTLVPRFLRNSVIESYMTTYPDNPTGPPRQTSNRSCMNCHGTVGADFSYLWLDAVSQRVPINLTSR